METAYYNVTGYNMSFYCKVGKFINPYTNTYKATFTFGSRRANCVTIAYDNSKPTIAYIDYVIYDGKCFSGGEVIERNNATYKLTITALHTMLKLFPTITNFTLKDNSHKYCIEGTKEYKLSLAADYIFKYNKTWYEAKFGAMLPEPIYSEYRETLTKLDMPLFDFSVLLPSYLHKYEDIYRESNSPRDFIQHVREFEKEDYCLNVGPWLHHFLFWYGVTAPDDYCSLWYIPIEKITAPPGYSLRADANGGGKYRRKITRKKRVVREVVTYQSNNGCMATSYNNDTDDD